MNYEELIEPNEVYKANIATWTYHLNSYLGGEAYRSGSYLTRYAEEDDDAYKARTKACKLDNHCSSIISVYNSFLFREQPTRELGSLEGLQEIDEFKKDTDYDGRNLNSFMKEVSTWTSVYGHCWIIVAKPNINAETRADEIALQVRPYNSLITPVNVLDWNYIRQPNGLYVLDYLKYIEEETKDILTIKEWTPELINTYVLSKEDEKIQDAISEDNQLGSIPAVIAYADRSTTRGIGISDINDIADAQKYIYNLTSEIEQSVRIDIHKSLVKTAETKANAGAGSIINMPDQMDPGLKPYLLQSSAADVSAILKIVTDTVENIDKMSNTGAVRAVESKSLSGVAMETEFQLLNARLSEKADNLELAEEQMWHIIASYQNKEWNGIINYPGSFNIQDTNNQIKQIKVAKEITDDTGINDMLDKRLVETMGEDPEEIMTNNPITVKDSPTV